LPAASIARAAGFKEGVVSTGNSLDYTTECMRIMHANQAAVKEMEAAAVAYVCELWNVPMFAIKSVTDIVDGDRAAAEEFLANLGKATQALKVAVASVLGYMQGKSPSDL
jgi:5'-methylthioadenosine nucleosidase